MAIGSAASVAPRTPSDETLVIDGPPAEVIGVLPASFRFLRTRPEIVLPMPLDVNAPRGISFGFQALARLKPGVTLTQANADVARADLAASARLRADWNYSRTCVRWPMT